MKAASEIALKMTDNERDALRYMAKKRTICGGTKTMEGFLRGLASLGLVHFHRDGRDLALAGPPVDSETGVVSITDLGDEVNKVL